LRKKCPTWPNDHTKKKQKKIAIQLIKSKTNKKETNNYNKKELNKKKLKLRDNIDKDNKKKFDLNAKYIKKKINFNNNLFSLKSKKK
jgi:hypothetical protein